MKQYTIGIAAIIAILALAFILGRESGRRAETASTAKVLQVKNDSIRHITDLYGTEHAEKQQNEADLSTLKTAYENDVNDLKTRLGVSEKQIAAFEQAGTRTKDSVHVKVDTIYKEGKPQYVFAYDDPWFSASGNLADQSLSYDVKDSLVITSYWRRPWLLGRKTVYVNAFSLNPHTHITGLQGVKIKEKEPGRFGIGPYIGIGYTDAWRLNVGISLQYSLIRF